MVQLVESSGSYCSPFNRPRGSAAIVLRIALQLSCGLHLSNGIWGYGDVLTPGWAPTQEVSPLLCTACCCTGPRSKLTHHILFCVFCYVGLKSKQTTEHWTRRGVALLTQLDTWWVPRPTPECASELAIFKVNTAVIKVSGVLINIACWVSLITECHRVLQSESSLRIEWRVLYN